MEVRYPPDTEPGERLPVLLEQATAALAKLRTKRLATFPAAEWHRRLDARGQTVHTLTLRDEEGEVSEDFTHDELANPRYVAVSTSRLYLRLLAIHSDHARDRYLIAVGMPGEAE